MPVTDAEFRELRLRYEAAYDAHQGCVRALDDAERGRERPSAQLLASEAEALKELNEARRRYRDALIEIDFLSDDPLH